MNHDYTHCTDYTNKCPNECFRAQLAKDLELTNKHLKWISFASLKGTEECINAYDGITNKKGERHMGEYRKLVFMKTYDEMTQEELDFCIKTEIDYYKDRVNKLREENVPDYKIAAYIYDLWQDYLIADDVELAEAYGISDEDWEKGLNYWWYDMDEPNPLRD